VIVLLSLSPYLSHPTDPICVDFSDPFPAPFAATISYDDRLSSGEFSSEKLDASTPCTLIQRFFLCGKHVFFVYLFFFGTSISWTPISLPAQVPLSRHE